MATKCTEKAIKKCVTKSQVCNTETKSGSCLEISTAIQRVKKDDSLKLDTKKGVFGKKETVKGISITLDPADIAKLKKIKNEINEIQPKKTAVPLPPVVAQDDSPDDFTKEGVAVVAVQNLKEKTMDDLRKILKDLGGSPFSDTNRTKPGIIKTINELRAKKVKASAKVIVPPPIPTEPKESPIKYTPTPVSKSPAVKAPVSTPEVKKLKTVSPVEIQIKPVSFISMDDMKTRKWTIENLRELLKTNYNVDTKKHIKKADILELVLKTQEEKRKKLTVNIDSLDCDNSYNVQTGACEEPQDDLYVLEYNGKKYHGTEKDLGLFAQFNKFHGYKIVKKEKNEFKNEFQRAVESCEELNCDESCNIETGECEEPEQYVLEYNGKQFHGSKENLEMLVKSMNFEDYRIRKVGDVVDEDEEQQFEFQPEEEYVSLRELEESPEFDIQEYQEPKLHVSPLTPPVTQEYKEKRIALGKRKQSVEPAERAEKYIPEPEPEQESTIQGLINLADTVSGTKHISKAEAELIAKIKRFIDDEEAVV
jgi:hypothetical protein